MWEYFPKLKFQLTIAEFQLKIREILLNIPFLWSIFVCITNHWWYFIHAQLVIFKLLEFYSRWNMRKIHIQKACIWIKELWTFLPPTFWREKTFMNFDPTGFPRQVRPTVLMTLQIKKILRLFSSSLFFATHRGISKLTKKREICMFYLIQKKYFLKLSFKTGMYCNFSKNDFNKKSF